MMKNKTFRQSMRIVLSIAAKDTLDAFKNRTILSLAFGVLALMFSAKVLPMLLSVRAQPVLVVYDAGNSAVVQELEARSDMQLVQFGSEAEMKSLLVDTQQLMIGLTLPAGMGSVSAGDEIVLDGYYPNWANPARVREQIAFFEGVLRLASGADVRIDIEGHVVYPTVEPGLPIFMVTQTSVLMILLMGVMLVPYLFLAEKEQHTMDALLVSPASYGQLVVGKALAGMVYCLVAALIVILFNYHYFVHWDLAVLAILLGCAFSVLAGLLVGMLVENQASMGLWMGLLLLLLVGPSVTMSLGGVKLPEVAATLFSWTPGVAFNDLLKMSMYGPVQAIPVVKNAAVLTVSSVILFVLNVWRVRRMDR